MTSERRALGLGALVLATLATFVLLQLRVVTDILHFLPAGADAENVQLARELAAGELSRMMVVLVDAPDRETAARASRTFERELRAEPHVGDELAFLDASPPAGVEEALYELYEPRRFGFVAADVAAARARLTPAALEVAARDLKDRLLLPMSTVLTRIAPADPLLVLEDLFKRLATGRGEGLSMHDDRFLTADGSAAVLFLATRSSASSGTVQRPFLDGLHAAFARMNTEFGGVLELGLSGTNRFAVRAEEAIRADIERVSVGSTVGLVAFLLLVFGSLRLVGLVLPVLATAFLSGTLACQLLFGSVHGLTLAFGAALIGVTIDYAIHFQCHHVLAPEPGGPSATLRAIWRPLVLGAATTITGFLALVASSFPGLRQLAVFAVCGILGAVLATRLFLPGLSARTAQPTARAQWLVRRLGGWFGAGVNGSRRGWLLVPLVVATLLAAAGLPMTRWNDDIAAMNRLDPELQAADEAVRERVVRYEQGRLVVALGDSEQAALEVNDRVAAALRQLEADAALGGFRSIEPLVPSAKRQRAVDAVVRGDDGLFDRATAALGAAGFRTSMFEPFRTALAQPAPQPVVPADLDDTPLEALVRPFRIELPTGIGFLSFLHDLRDADALSAAIGAIPGARYVDVPATLTAAYAGYRTRLLQLWLVGLAAVLGLVFLRHRSLRLTAIACGPALLAAGATVGLLGLLGVELNMLTLVALLMVVSMGVDYGVFLAETAGDPRRLSASLLAVVVAGISTALGFGLLALSDQPPLFSIGLTSLVGVLLCLALAPTLCAAMGRRSS